MMDKTTSQITNKRKAKYSRITDEEVKQMFDYYLENDRSKYAVSKKFKRSRSGVDSIARRNNWVRRAKDIRTDIQKSLDKKAAREEIKNLALIRKVKMMIGDKVLKDKKYRATVAELTQLVRLEEELLQNLPAGGSDGDNVVNIVNDNTELARILANAQIGLKAIASRDSDRLAPL